MKNKVNLWGTHGATVLGITLVLFMLGLLLSIEYHSYRLTHDAQERITYKVDLSPEVSDSLALAQKAVVEQMSFVKHVDYISKEKAAEIPWKVGACVKITPEEAGTLYGLLYKILEEI